MSFELGALREGIDGRVTDRAFTTAGREFPRGTVVFPAGSNSPDKMARLTELSRDVGAHTVALESGWVDDGPNLGSEHFVRLTMPRVAVAWDDGVSQLSAGALRYVLEQRLGLPVTPIRTSRLGRADRCHRMGILRRQRTLRKYRRTRQLHHQMDRHHHRHQYLLRLPLHRLLYYQHHNL